MTSSFRCLTVLKNLKPSFACQANVICIGLLFFCLSKKSNFSLTFAFLQVCNVIKFQKNRRFFLFLNICHQVMFSAIVKQAVSAMVLSIVAPAVTKFWSFLTSEKVDERNEVGDPIVDDSSDLDIVERLPNPWMEFLKYYRAEHGFRFVGRPKQLLQEAAIVYGNFSEDMKEAFRYCVKQE